MVSQTTSLSYTSCCRIVIDEKHFNRSPNQKNDSGSVVVYKMK
jgi:hypothetical protein